MDPVYRNGKYEVDEDPEAWSASVADMIAHLQAMADQGYEEVQIGPSHGNEVYASFSRPATPDEVAMEREAHARLMGRGGE